MKKYFLFLSLILLTACSSGPVEKRVPPTLGNANAPVLLEEFADFQCPACAQISPLVEAIARKHPDVIRFEYHHFPLSYHPYSFRAAEASECAADQGKFWDYAALLFKNQTNLADDQLYSFASKLSLDATAFKTCLTSEVKKGQILADQKDGNDRQLPGTPSLFVNGKMVRFSGAEAFEAYLLSAAKGN